jgi:hypothetical protein
MYATAFALQEVHIFNGDGSISLRCLILTVHLLGAIQYCTWAVHVTGRTRYMVQYRGIGTAGSILNYGAAHN